MTVVILARETRHESLRIAFYIKILASFDQAMGI